MYNQVWKGVEFSQRLIRRKIRNLILAALKNQRKGQTETSWKKKNCQKGEVSHWDSLVYSANF